MEIIADGIYKSYNGKSVLKDINFRVSSGETFLYAGPNGAGKTTTVNIALNFITPDKGNILFNGKLVDDNLRKHIGVMLEFETGYSNMNVYENLYFLSKIYNKQESRIEDILDIYGLNKLKNYSYGILSKGMKRCLRLAMLEFIDPEVLILDEPTVGLDIENIEILKKQLLRMKNSGKTIFLCSHNLFFAWEIADKIAFIKEGTIIKYCGIKELENTYSGKVIITNTSEHILNILKKNSFRYSKIGNQKIKIILNDINTVFKLKQYINIKDIISERDFRPEDIYKIIIGDMINE